MGFAAINNSPTSTILLRVTEEIIDAGRLVVNYGDAAVVYFYYYYY